MNNIKVYTVSLGCPKNRVDTEKLLGTLGDKYSPATELFEADLVLVNTCAFIEPAVEESLDVILGIVKECSTLKTKKPLIAVAGCLVSRYADDIQKELPEVDIWLSTKEIDNWGSVLAEKFGSIFSGEERFLEDSKTYAYVKVGEGCSHNCQFCTIPFIRGKQKSFALDYLLKDARFVLSKNIPEIILVGQDTSSWGTDFKPKAKFQELVSAFTQLEEEGLKWLRLMYLYPAGLDDSFLEFMAKLTDSGTKTPLLPYFDVPLQHAHEEVLASMGRPFAKEPRKVIEKVRGYFPTAALRTSLIVGYPGETEEHFNYLCDFVREARFHHLGVFSYWAEDGTKAAKLPNQVDAEIKKYRKDTLMQIQQEVSEEILREYRLETLEILIESQSPEWENLYVGRTWFQAPEVDGLSYVSALPDGQIPQIGTFVQAQIEDTTKYDLSALALL